MKKILNPEKSQWEDILSRPLMSLDEVEARVIPILEKVQSAGDDALKFFSEKFDGVRLESLEVSEQEFAEAESLLDDELKVAIQKASENIHKFHTAQQYIENKVETQSGVVCWRKSIAIEKVGLYIPGGTAPLFSTVLMLAIPARIADCKKVIICTPPNREGKVHPAILYAARLTGVHQVFKAGGAQAIAAMIFGTDSIPKVYKILGPGNQYVTAAKQMAMKYGVAIDMPAGPSEVAVIADGTANPAFIAADLLSQAEHGVDSQVILLTDSEKIMDEVEREVQLQLKVLPRAQYAYQALNNSKLILVKDMDEALEMSDLYAPEHLILQVQNPELLSEKITNAGSVFLGHFTPESAGDYASGTNHTLPTNGYAKVYSGVSLDTFMKKVTFQKISSEGLQKLGPVIEKMAEAEHLDAHKNAVSIRLKNLK